MGNMLVHADFGSTSRGETDSLPWQKEGRGGEAAGKDPSLPGATHPAADGRKVSTPHKAVGFQVACALAQAT